MMVFFYIYLITTSQNNATAPYSDINERYFPPIEMNHQIQKRADSLILS